MAIAAAENAAANGVAFMRERAGSARSTAPDEGSSSSSPPRADVGGRVLINARRQRAAQISRMAGGAGCAMVWRQGNIAVLDQEAAPHAALPGADARIEGVIVTGNRARQHRHHRDRRDASAQATPDTYADDIGGACSPARASSSQTWTTRRVVRRVRRRRAPYFAASNDFLIRRRPCPPRAHPGRGHQSPGVASAPAVAERTEQLVREAGVALADRARLGPASAACRTDFDTRLPRAQEALIRGAIPPWGRIVCRCETGAGSRDRRRPYRREPGRYLGRGRQAPVPRGHGPLPERLLPESSVVGDPRPRTRVSLPRDVPLEDAGSPIVVRTASRGTLR
ncbi:MAG: hypothetical protein ACLTSX_06540 [Collinsella sp.]